ncbi:MAG TPA: MarR family winged helix-turn-helix transcriptional regulator [Candidatus Acidoferrales bacterium]|nr:MarR family winged helix-turn-helix transcriptional regulator [Candidatus Acidoferrales bacterium]
MTKDYASGTSMLRLALACRRFQKRLASGTGLSTNEIICLLILYLQELKSVSELSSIVDLSCTSTSKILSKLQKMKYIEIALHSSDRRKEQVVLTDLGRGMSERLLSSSKDLATEVLASLPENMRAEFANWIQWHSVENSSEST